MSPAFLGRLRTLLRSLWMVLIFCGALAASCALLGAVLPWGDVPQVSAKLAYLAAHRDDFDTLFIGSSRVQRQLDPTLFDQLAHAHGLESHAFNGGIDSMFSPEDIFFCEKILALKPARLRRVFIESSWCPEDFGGNDPASVRVAYWHDFKRTCLLAKVIFRYPSKRRLTVSKFLEYAGRFSEHGWIFCKRSLNLGRGVAAFSDGGLAPVPLTPFLGTAGNGYRPVDRALDGVELVRYEKVLAKLKETPSPEFRYAPAVDAAFCKLFEAIRAAGAEPILMLSPSTSSARFFLREPKAALMLDFSDPDTYPELFKPENRLDVGHLNLAGARLYTRAFAERYFQALDARR